MRRLTWELAPADESARRAWLPPDIRRELFGTTDGDLIVKGEGRGYELPAHLWPGEIVLRGPAECWRSTYRLRLSSSTRRCLADVLVTRSPLGVRTTLTVLRVERAPARVLAFPARPGASV